MRIKSWGREFGWGFFAAALVFGAALLCGARRRLIGAVNDHEPGTTWTIMMSDESKVAQVNAALKSLDGVKGTELVTPEEAFKNLAADPSIRPQLETLKTNPFHSYFKVAWDLQQSKPQVLESQAQSIRQWPGIGTVVSHPSQIKVAHELRTSLAEINLALYGGLFGLAAFSLLWVGFNLPEFSVDAKMLFRIISWDGAFGVAGFLCAKLLLDSQFPSLLGLGFLMGLVRSAGASGRPAHAQDSSQNTPLPSLQSEPQ
jgi:hypothetical protein